MTDPSYQSSSWGSQRDFREELWLRSLRELGLDSADLLSESGFDPFRRTYLSGHRVYKIVLDTHETSSGQRAQDLSGEYAILQLCSGIVGVPSVRRHFRSRDVDVLITDFVPGRPMDQLELGWWRFLITSGKLLLVLSQIAKCGVSHNDVVPSNVLVSSDGEVSLVDFDQATHAKPLVALARSIMGISVGESKIHGSFLYVLRQYLKRRLPEWLVSWIRVLLRKQHESDPKHVMPELAPDASSEARLLWTAWDMAQRSNASSPGALKAYYSFDYDGYHFPGERSWRDRWQVLQGITQYSGRRVLELGCNMALLSTFLLKEKGCSAALAVDVDDAVLEAARYVGMALGVQPTLRVQNLDASFDWETELADFDPDIVFALSVLNWVEDKERLMTFLGRFQEVIFEGHETVTIETERFKGVGFGQVRLVSTSKRGRPILHCLK